MVRVRRTERIGRDGHLAALIQGRAGVGVERRRRIVVDGQEGVRRTRADRQGVVPDHLDGVAPELDRAGHPRRKVPLEGHRCGRVFGLELDFVLASPVGASAPLPDVDAQTLPKRRRLDAIVDPAGVEHARRGRWGQLRLPKLCVNPVGGVGIEPERERFGSAGVRAHGDNAFDLGRFLAVCRPRNAQQHATNENKRSLDARRNLGKPHRLCVGKRKDCDYNPVRRASGTRWALSSNLRLGQTRRQRARGFSTTGPLAPNPSRVRAPITVPTTVPGRHPPSHKSSRRGILCERPARPRSRADQSTLDFPGHRAAKADERPWRPGRKADR